MNPVLSGGAACVAIALYHSRPAASLQNGVPSGSMAQVHPFCPLLMVESAKPSLILTTVASFTMSAGAAVITFVTNSLSPLGTSAVSSAAMLEVETANASDARMLSHFMATSCRKRPVTHQ